MAATNGVQTMAATKVVQTMCEQDDWEWARFKEITNLANITQDGIGNRRIGVALVGLGRMGQIHMQNLLREPRANLLYCFDADTKSIDAWSRSMIFREYGIKALLSDQFDVALKDPRVRAVVVVCPHIYHEHYVKRALEAGKNVMCEKPLTLETSRCKPLFELAKEKKVFLFCSFQRRYDPDFRKMYKMVKNENVGSVHLIRIASRDSQTPPLSYVKISGNLIHDSVIHDLDMSLWYLRQLPVRVQVVGKTWKEHFDNNPEAYAALSEEDRETLKGINDLYTLVLTLKFPNGAMATIDSSRQSCYGYDQRCEIYGVKGMLKCEGKVTGNTLEYTNDSVKQSSMTYAFASRYSTAYQNELRDILTMAELADNGLQENRAEMRKYLIEPNRPALVQAALKIADAGVESWKTDKPVTLEWTDDFRKEFELDIE